MCVFVCAFCSPVRILLKIAITCEVKGLLGLTIDIDDSHHVRENHD